MPKYGVDVTEVRHVRCSYVVEADTPEDALRLAAGGDTVAEEEVKNDGVFHREVFGDTLTELVDE